MQAPAVCAGSLPQLVFAQSRRGGQRHARRPKSRQTCGCASIRAELCVIIDENNNVVGTFPFFVQHVQSFVVYRQSAYSFFSQLSFQPHAAMSCRTQVGAETRQKTVRERLWGELRRRFAPAPFPVRPAGACCAVAGRGSYVLLFNAAGELFVTKRSTRCARSRVCLLAAACFLPSQNANTQYSVLGPNPFQERRLPRAP